MKKIYSYAFAASVLMLASCSNESDPVINGGNETTDGKYLAVNICAPSGTTRGNEGDFEKGSSNENAVNSALFLLFDAQNQLVQAISKSQFNDSDWSAVDNSNPAVEKISKAILVVDADKQPPTQLMVILNPSDALKAEFVNSDSKTDVKSMNLDGAMAIAGQYNTYSEGTFVMSNSQYFDENNQKSLATSISGHLTTDAAYAIEHPVDVYVERVAAKVRATTLSGFGEDQIEVTVDGVPQQLDLKLEGIGVANVANKTYAIKNISDISANWSTFNDIVNKRSYWANMPNDVAYENQSWSAYGSKFTENTLGGESFYTLENTTSTPTHILVTASLQKDGNPYSFYYWAGSYYALGDNNVNLYATMKQVVKDLGYKKVVTKGGQEVEMDFENTDFDVITEDEHEVATGMKTDISGTVAATATATGKRYLTYVKLNESFTANSIKKNGTELASVEAARTEINEILSKDVNKVMIWKDGKCYYYLPIEHFGPVQTTAEDATPTFDYRIGMVRNHIYDLSLESIAGLGTPVFYPEEIIIPEKREDDNFYMAARINILKWKIVSQRVNFDM